MIGIIGAMQVEVDAILKYVDNIKEMKKWGITFYEGSVGDKKVVVVLSGVGKVNATISTSLLLNEYPIEYVINIGSAGGLLQDQKILDVVVATEVLQHDYDTSYLDGEDGLGISAYCDKKLIEIANDVLADHQIKGYLGKIACGDQFIGELSKINKLLSTYSDIIACDMESGAIGYVCNKAEIPCLILRSLSDVTFNEDSNMDFLEYVGKASVVSADLVVDLVKKI